MLDLNRDVNMEDGDYDDEFKEENPKKKFKKHLYKPPTAEELNNLRETESLFHSNLFRLQISELLTEISLKQVEIEKYEQLVTDLIDFLNQLKPLKEKKIKNLEFFKKHNLNVPLSGVCERLDGEYTFLTPKSVNLIGSFKLKSIIKPNVCIDIAIEMPKEYFNERDFLNYRYFIKRILYMSNVCVKLIKQYEDSHELFFNSEYSSVYKPNLILKPKNHNEKYEIFLHFVPEHDTFKLHRFNPDRNNVRKQWFFKSNESVDNSENDTTPTFHYNYSVLSDLKMIENNKYLNDALIASQSLVDAIKLLKLWLYQRQLNQGYGSFNNFILSMYVAYLLSIKRINPLMSSYQIYRIVLLNLSQETWNVKALTLSNQNNNEDEHCLKSDEYLNYYSVTFIDSSGYLNICSNLNLNTFFRVKHEAALAIEFLNNQFIDSFDALFMKKFRFIELFDVIINIQNFEKENLFGDIVDRENLSEQLIDTYNNSVSISVPVIEKYIQKALDTRIRLCFTQLIANIKWPINANVPQQPNSISIGILFDKNYTNQLIKGPLSNLPEAKEFRNFWGDISELRRFQDGAICEAVYFEANDIANKRLIYSKIIKHILNRHLSIDDKHIQTIDKQLDRLISLPKEVIENYGTGEERLTNIVHVFDDFVKILTNLKDMPLSFANIQGLSSTLRLTNVFAPLPCCFKYDNKSEKHLRFKIGQKYLPVYPLGKCIAPYVEPIKISCLLETSNKWPDDLECIKRLKCAFNIKFVQLLRDLHSLIAFTNVEFSDVFYKGYVFRLFIYTSRELAIMKTSVNNETSIISTHDTDESLKLEKNIFLLPKLTSALRGLQQEHNHYSGVTRLAKRWLSCQLLMDYYTEESIDLLCAYLFVHPEPYEPPKYYFLNKKNILDFRHQFLSLNILKRSLISGFMRFIHLLANFDFKTQAITINLNNEFKKDNLVEIQLNFQTNRTKLPLIFIATPYDGNQRNSIWTKDKPDLPTLCRTILLAKDCLKQMELFNFNYDNSQNFKNLFQPSTIIYDVIIHLKAEYCPKAYQQLDLAQGTFLPHYREYDAKIGEKTLPIVDFDPVRLYVKQLRDAYSEYALFFYDLYGGTEIYVLWKPKSFEARDFKISNVNGRLLVESGKKIVPNVEAIVEDFKILGNELVKDVTVKIERLTKFQ